MVFPTFLTIRSWKTQGVIIKAIYSLLNVLLTRLFAVWQWVIALGGDNPSVCEVWRGDSLRPSLPPAEGKTHPKSPRGHWDVPGGFWGPRAGPATHSR